MASPAPRGSEQLYCHACERQGPKHGDRLECSFCHSGAVEVVSSSWDPPQSTSRLIPTQMDNSQASPSLFGPHDDAGSDSSTFPTFHPPPDGDRLPQHPLHYHNPWDATDPDNPHFTHREWRPTPNTRITRTTFQSNSAGVPNLLTMMGGETLYGPANTGANPFPPTGVMFPTDFPRHHHHHHHHHHDVQQPWGMPRDPSTPGPGAPFHTPFGPTALGAQDAGATINGLPFDLNNLFQTLFAQPPQRQQGAQPGQRGGAPNFATMLSSIFNPAAFNGGQHGDAVYSEEAFDRLLTQFLEQNSGSNAPGPAPAAAIAALPKVKVEEKMMGNDGKAECSVCMENVEVGDEVTMLPCKHWFHGECVGAWLQEHNTCPHCRQGIASTPATPSAGPQPQQAMPGSYPFQRYRSAGPPSPMGVPGSSPSNPFSVPSSPGASSSSSSLHPSSPAGWPTRTSRTRSFGSSASFTSGRNGNGGFHFSIQAGAPSSSSRPPQTSPRNRRRDLSFSSSRSPSDEQRHHSRTHSNSGTLRNSRQSGRRGDANTNGSGSFGNNAGGGGITGWVRQRFGGS